MEKEEIARAVYLSIFLAAAVGFSFAGYLVLVVVMLYFAFLVVSFSDDDDSERDHQ